MLSHTFHFYDLTPIRIIILLVLIKNFERFGIINHRFAKSFFLLLMFVQYKFVLMVRYEYRKIHMVSFEHSIFDKIISPIEEVELYLSSEQSCIKLTRGSVDIPVVCREVFVLWINILESVEKFISEGVLKVIIFAQF